MALTDNLVAYWKLDESSGNVVDSVASLTLTNAGTTGFVSAKINNGVDGGASNSTKYFYTEASAPLTYAQLGSAWTVSAWINMYDTTSDKSFFYCMNTDGSYRRHANLRFDNASDKFQVTTYPSGTVVNGTTTVSASTWYHVVGTYDGTTLRIYLNGASDGSTALTYGSPATPSLKSVSILGQRYSGATYEITSAKMDECGIWSRALSSTEVTSLYNSGSGLQYPFVTTSVKTAKGLAVASVKTKKGLAVASVKTYKGLA